MGELLDFAITFNILQFNNHKTLSTPPRLALQLYSSWLWSA